MCGLAIVDRAAQATADDPEMPMRVGVGVHAGEAIEVPEGGYIGTAVNLAARVCSVAEAGEVLVTSHGPRHRAGEHSGHFRARAAGAG